MTARDVLLLALLLTACAGPWATDHHASKDGLYEPAVVNQQAPPPQAKPPVAYHQSIIVTVPLYIDSELP